MFKFFSLSLYFSSSKMKKSWKTRFFKRKIGSWFVTASFSPPQLCPISGGTLLHMPTLWWYVPTYAHCPPSGGTPLPMPTLWWYAPTYATIPPPEIPAVYSHPAVSRYQSLSPPWSLTYLQSRSVVSFPYVSYQGLNPLIRFAWSRVSRSRSRNSIISTPQHCRKWSDNLLSLTMTQFMI